MHHNLEAVVDRSAEAPVIRCSGLARAPAEVAPAMLTGAPKLWLKPKLRLKNLHTNSM